MLPLAHFRFVDSVMQIYLRIKWHLDPSSHFATLDMGRKVGVLCPFVGELNPHLTQRCLGRDLPPYQIVIFVHPAVWPQQTLAENWGLCPFGGAGFPCNTMSPGPTSTSLSSGILIHPAVWPQQTRAENGGGGGVPLFKRELRLRVTQCGLGRGLPQYQVAP